MLGNLTFNVSLIVVGKTYQSSEYMIEFDHHIDLGLFYFFVCLFCLFVCCFGGSYRLW